MGRRPGAARLPLLLPPPPLLPLLLLCGALAEPRAAGPDTHDEAQLRIAEWLDAGSAASYAQLEVVRSLNIPVVINLVMFAGFDKNGNLGGNLEQHFGTHAGEGPDSCRDWATAAELALDLNRLHVQENMTSVLMWTPIYSWCECSRSPCSIWSLQPCLWCFTAA